MEIKKATKRERVAYMHHAMSNETSIYDAYKAPSTAKVRAWQYCKDLCERYGGTNLKVIGHNCMQFSAGFRFKTDEHKECFMYITASSDTPVYI